MLKTFMLAECLLTDNASMNELHHAVVKLTTFDLIYNIKYFQQNIGTINRCGYSL
jgi:hypothetical protein